MTITKAFLIGGYAGFVLFYFLIQFNIPQPNRLLPLIVSYQAVLVLCTLLAVIGLARAKLRTLLKVFIGAVTIPIGLFFFTALIMNVRIQHRVCSNGINDFTPFWVVTQDNIQISGMAKLSHHGRAIVLMHGVADNKTDCQFLKLASILSKKFDIYLFDFRGYGQSSGASTFGNLEILDLRAVFDLVFQRHYSAIGLIGNSMGGMVAIRFAAQDARVDALVIAGTPASVVDPRGGEVETLSLILNNFIGRRIYWIFTQIPVSDTLAHISTNEKIADSPINLIGKISPIPILIIHGKKDKIVTIENAYLLYAQAHQPKDLVLYENGGHSITELSQEYGDPFRQILLNWLDKNLY